MPMPGPVAYQVHARSFVVAVISTGLAHVTPLSDELESQTERDSRAVPARISRSLSVPRLWVSSSQIVPVVSSTTAQGFPQVLVASSQTTCWMPQVLPPSADRLSRTSISPPS